MPPLLGIDFGTTNTVAAYLDERTNKVELVLQNGNSFPSCVKFSKSGKEIACPLNSPFYMKDVALTPKRLIGRSFHHKFINSIKDKCGLPLCEVGPCPSKYRESCIHEVGYMLPNGKKASAVDVCTKVLRKVKEIAEKKAGCEIKDAVITIPVQYSWEQRQETCRAAENAGFNVLCLQYEPVMAAYEYCNTHNFTKGTLLVFDFGGGTVDSTVISVEDEVFKVVDTYGDSFLGGDDLTNDVLNDLLKVGRENRYIDGELSVDRRIKLKKTAERLKKGAGNNPKVDLVLDDMFGSRDKDQDSRHVVQFSIIQQDIIRHVTSAVNLAAQLGTKHKIDRVLMIGGSSAFCLCKQMMEERFEGIVNMDFDPKYCVARGAARCPRALNAVDNAVQFRNTVVHGLGILQKGNYPFYLIKSGELLPLEGEQEIQLVNANDMLCTEIVEEMDGDEFVNLCSLRIDLGKKYPKDSIFILKFALKNDLLLYYSVYDNERNVVCQMKKLILRSFV